MRKLPILCHSRVIMLPILSVVTVISTCSLKSHGYDYYNASHSVALSGYNASAGRLAHLLPGLDQSLLSSPPADPREMLKIVSQITVPGFKLVLPYLFFFLDLEF